MQNKSQPTSFKLLKSVFISAAAMIICVIIIITIDAIYEVDDWVWFNIDFTNSYDSISAYGSLIGGILSFLSIMFVIYTIIEQKERTHLDDINKDFEIKKDLYERLKLLSTYLSTTIVDILSHGENMKTYYEEENSFPSRMHLLYFSVNKNFNRIIEMDNITNYKAFQYFFNDDENWEKDFLNLYKLIDFYSEAFIDLRAKYKLHNNDKVREHKLIGSNLDKLLSDGTTLIDEYLILHGNPTHITFAWPALLNDFIYDFNTYLESCKLDNDIPDLRYMSDNLVQKFLKEAMNIRISHGYDIYGSRELVKSASAIMKKIFEVETYAQQYAQDLKMHYEYYFQPDNNNIEKLKNIKSKIDEKILELKKFYEK